MKRRHFLKTAAGLGAGLAISRLNSRNYSQAAEPQAAGSAHSVRLGGPVFVPDTDPDVWAAAAREKYRAVYAPNVALGDRDRIKAVVDAVKKHDLVIAEVGRWNNMLDADPAKREANLKSVTEGLALAEELGAKCCVNIAGSDNPTNWAGPAAGNFSDEFFEQTVENARRIIDAVKPKRAKFAIEMMSWAIPDSADSYLKLARAIDREGFGFHIDICNIINSPRVFWNTTALINDTFDKLGPRIVSAHAKDLKWIEESSIHFAECVIGEGKIDFVSYLKRMAALPDKDVPLMIEHMANAEEYERCRLHLLKLGKENGVAFGM